ncbi:transcriptional regulator [Clostridia bacterium]|nr:transcriptional regulator [Clostridia bacterium]
MNIGEKIKQLRVRNSLTQEELGNRSELSKGFISQVERNITSPSIATLLDILEALGTDIKDFFSDAPDEKIVFHSEDFFVQENSDHVIHWIIPNAQKNKMEPILLKLKPRGRSSTYTPHEGELFGYVLSGSVILSIGTSKHKVQKDESFYYKANCDYYIENKSRDEANVIWVCTPPNF